MPRIFVCESLSAAACAAPDEAADELLQAGIAMRDAIVDDLLRIDDVKVTCAVGPGSDRGPPTPGPRGRLQTTTPRCGERLEAFVARMAPLHDFCWIVAPETGGDLARLHAAVGDARWIGCDAGAIACAASKSATLAVLSAAGVATPLDAVAPPRGRWIAKPDDGAGCLSTSVHADLASALASAQGRALVVQPFVEGEALSVSMIVGADLAEVVAFNRQRIEIDGAGRLHDRGVQSAALDADTDPRIALLACAALATARALPGLGGFVGIDVVWHPQQGAVVIEVNPRVTCAYVGLSGQLGRNLAADVLRLKAFAAANRECRHGQLA